MVTGYMFGYVQAIQALINDVVADVDLINTHCVTAQFTRAVHIYAKRNVYVLY